MGQDQVSRGASILCWLAAPVVILQDFARLFPRPSLNVVLDSIILKDFTFV